MIIYCNTNREYFEGEGQQTQISHGFGYKIKRHRKPKSIKGTIVRASTSKSKTNKLKSLRRENIQFLSKLGFKVKKN